MQDFAAIDFETANFERSSVCSVGVVIVRGGEIVDSTILSYSPNRIITNGVVRRFMVLRVKIRMKHQCLVRYGSR